MEWRFGPHTLSFEEPDLVRVTFHGQMDVKEQQEMYAFVEEIRARQKDLYLLGDLRLGTGFSPRARRSMGENADPVQYRAMAFFGASFTVRTIFNMLGRAQFLMGRKTASMAFTETEQEARQWLAQQRALHVHSS
ncbi:STAS/SEC14 domain-containing protein [Stigmatella sp. ncwal1]|uniref:STAS/SEC14 domain-containing protein n=1 Tax=Stigmatella ashevillensis TaxID=2995309 RepID=A0ABT5DKU4_9BACT|nr:STAS/SEC14 domain-containing protein [Stigmatella ashevillena]MDC0713743.1 STAS/SEC14 domain-containing protein [Stigmatella ashevillena]